MTATRPPSPLICPRCRVGLTAAPGRLQCPACRAVYPVEDGVADFSGGIWFDEFGGPGELSVAQRLGLENEVAGTVARVRDFYGPLLAKSRDAGRPLRVLDSGCGNGLSIDLLADLGVEAWGNDLSRLRRWQWRERRQRERLVIADTRRLPFPDAYFDAVISSGVIEHIGVTERGGVEYAVVPLPDRDGARVEFLRELLRVTAAAGTLYLDCPNGAFPIDFWHGVRPGGARLHSPAEGFLPTAAEIRGYLGAIGDYRARPLSPHRRLRMKQVGRHWFGRLFRLPVAALLALMRVPGFRWLAGGPLNPYLVLRIEKEPPRASPAAPRPSALPVLRPGD